jgi:hypothetical protein
MSRNFPDWIEAYLQYTDPLEAPRRMYFWTAVSALAGTLRRRVWIGGSYFKWYPNFYVILVAPPGIVSKSTTASVAMNLLRQVPGIKFGPDVVTWQSLVTGFAEAAEAFEYQGDFITQSAMTIASSEFGNLLNPHDREMVDLLITLWDGTSIEKKTKMSGDDSVVNPWINMIACTTPAWIAGNFPEHLIGGGFTSRCVFVYAEEKVKYCAHPWLREMPGIAEYEAKLVQDLEHIAMNLVGEYRLTPEAVAWGEAWYEHHHKNRPPHLDDERFGGYIARKQTHVYKLAMILRAATSDSMTIPMETLSTAAAMVGDLEQDMDKVFAKIGKSEMSNFADRMIWFVTKQEKCSYMDLYRFMHTYFPSMREFEDVLAGAIRAGLIVQKTYGNTIMLYKPGTETI